MRKLLAITVLAIFLPININALAEGEKPVLEEDRQEIKEKHHKNAEKILAFLKVAGMQSSMIKDAAYFVDERSEDGYFNIHKSSFNGINMSLRYDMGGLHRENLELNFRPDDSNFELNANPEQIMFRYKAEF